MNTLPAKLYITPALLLLSSAIAYGFLDYFIPSQLAVSEIFAPLAKLSQSYAAPISLALLALAAAFTLSIHYQHWRWLRGESPSCPRCGWMMQVRAGRRGVFWGCVRYPSCRGSGNY